MWIYFFVNLLHSLCVWLFDIWHLFDILISFWHLLAASHALLIAPTGRAAYNIHGCTIHHTFMIAVNRKLEHKALSWDNLNILWNQFHRIEWILLDEFSMVGNTMLKLIHLCLQEAKRNKLPFGGVNIICVGDLYQLQPVMQSHIFMDISTEYGPLATNLWKEYFTIFELTEIMQQKNDDNGKKCFVEYEFVITHQLTLISSWHIKYLKKNPLQWPIFLTCSLHETVLQNLMKLLQRIRGEITIVTAIDSPPSDITATMQKLILAAAQNKEVNSTGNLAYTLAVKKGAPYYLTANVDVEDRMVNGAECHVRQIEKNPANESFPKCIWVEFIDSAVGKN